MNDRNAGAAQRVGKYPADGDDVLLRILAAEALVLVIAVRTVGQVALGAVRVQDEHLRPAFPGGLYGICTVCKCVEVDVVIGGVVQIEAGRFTRFIPA